MSVFANTKLSILACRDRFFFVVCLAFRIFGGYVKAVSAEWKAEQRKRKFYSLFIWFCCNVHIVWLLIEWDDAWYLPVFWISMYSHHLQPKHKNSTLLMWSNKNVHFIWFNTKTHEQPYSSNCLSFPFLIKAHNYFEKKKWSVQFFLLFSHCS